MTVTRPVSCTPVRVATSTTTAALAASNANRNAGVIVNESAAILYVKFGATATATDYTYAVPAGGTLELPQPVYCGLIHGILASGTGNAQVSVY